jgi:L-lactate dehydrogenase complex protein LldG
MSSREQTLARIRTALGDVRRTPAVIDRGYRQPAGAAGLLELFVERVEDYRAVVTRCGEGEVAQALAGALAGVGSTLVPDGFPWSVANAVSDTGQAPAELDGIDAIVTTASVAIAETGTIVLTHGPGQGRRALSLVPDRHVCVVRAGQVVADVPDAISGVDPTRPQTWISGPSATSDIELNRVEGVHGPRTLHVILVDAERPADQA